MADNNGAERLVLLNRLVSRSLSRAPDEYKPPIVPATELFGVISTRNAKGQAIEFFGLQETGKDEETEEARIARGKGCDFIFLRQMKIEERQNWKFATLLFEFVDAHKRSFSVVDIDKLTGRDIQGNSD